MNLVTSSRVAHKHDLVSISQFPDIPNNLRTLSLYPKIDIAILLYLATNISCFIKYVLKIKNNQSLKINVSLDRKINNIKHEL